MGDVSGEEMLSETKHSCAAAAQTASTGDRASALGAGGCEPTGRADTPPAPAAWRGRGRQGSSFQSEMLWKVDQIYPERRLLRSLPG